MSDARPPRRPTESAAIAAADRSPRPLPSIERLLAAALVALRAKDRAGLILCLHRAVRAAVGDIEEVRAA